MEGVGAYWRQVGRRKARWENGNCYHLGHRKVLLSLLGHIMLCLNCNMLLKLDPNDIKHLLLCSWNSIYSVFWEAEPQRFCWSDGSWQHRRHRGSHQFWLVARNWIISTAIWFSKGTFYISGRWIEGENSSASPASCRWSNKQSLSWWSSSWAWRCEGEL